MSFLFKENRVDLLGNKIPKYNTKFHKAAAFVCRRGVASMLASSLVFVVASQMEPSSAHNMITHWGTNLFLSGMNSEVFMGVQRISDLRRVGFSKDELRNKEINKKPETGDQSQRYVSLAGNMKEMCTAHLFLYPFCYGFIAGVFGAFSPPGSNVLVDQMSLIAVSFWEEARLARQWGRVEKSEWVIEDASPVKEFEFDSGAKARAILDKVVQKMPQSMPQPGVA